MNQGPICAKVYPEGIQPIKGNNCGLIPHSGVGLEILLCSQSITVKVHRYMYRAQIRGGIEDNSKIIFLFPSINML